jgi:hypothetical protein
MPVSHPRRLHRPLFAITLLCAVPLLAACPKKETPVVDAGPPPAPVEDAAPMVLEEMVEDAGADADAADAKPKYTGPAVNPNVLKLKQCCNALANEGNRMGSSPEGAMFKSAAVQCHTLAAQAGPSGNAPEFAAVRNLLAGRSLPAACAGL